MSSYIFYLQLFFIFLELSPVCNKQELKIDRTVLHKFIVQNVLAFWNSREDYNVDDGIIDLYSLLDNKISQYLLKWDRSTLVLVIIYYY